MADPLVTDAEAAPPPAATTADSLVVSEPKLFTDLTDKRLGEIIAAHTTDPVRRPVRGIQLKSETFATIGVFDGESAKGVYDSSGTGKDGKVTHVTTHRTANFILQSVSIDMEEKFQPVQTFGLTYGFFFGERPHIYSFVAVLVDTDDFPWLIDWFHNYEEKLRGTKLTMDNTAVTVSVEEHRIKGYLTRCVLSKDASNPLMVQLNFSMWVTEHTTDDSPPGDTRVPYSGKGLNVSTTPQMWDTTDAVRRANVERLSAANSPGWLRKTIQNISAFKNKYDSAVQSVEDFLYNRSITTPALSVAVAELAVRGISSGQTTTFKPPAYYAYDHTEGKNVFNQNRDEYLLGSWVDARMDYGSTNPKDLVLSGKEGTSFSVSALGLVQQAKLAYEAKYRSIMDRTGAAYQDRLLENLGRSVLATAATIGAQAVLQGDLVAFASGTVEGTILAPFGKVRDQEGNVVDQFSFKKDVLAPMLGGLYTVATDATGTRTLSDSIVSQVQKARLEQTSASRDRNERRRALQAASGVEERASRLRAQQQAAEATTGASAAEAVLAAAREEAATALEAQRYRDQEAVTETQAAQKRQLIADFSRQAVT